MNGTTAHQNQHPGLWDTDDVISPEVKAFVRELGYHLSRDDAWALRSALGGERLNKTPGAVLDAIYAATVYAVLPEHLAETGHDSPEIREFVQQCAKAVKVLERYEGSDQHHFDDEVDIRTRRKAQEARDRAWPEGYTRGGLDEARKSLKTAPKWKDLRVQVEAEVEDRIRAKIRERVSAGQEIVSTLTDESEEPGSNGAHNAVTSENVLDDSEKVLAKLRAEEDTDPLSRDWAKAPRGSRTVYRRIMERFASGTETTVDERFLGELDPAQTCRQWLVANPFLLAVVDGVFIPLGDRQSEKAEDIAYFNGVKVNLANYPGIGEGENPLVGSNWKTDDLDDLYERIYLELVRAGGRPSTSQVVRIINEKFRKGRKAVSCTSARKAKKRLLDSGRLVEVKAARHYRDHHAWRTVPALLGAPENHPVLAATLDASEAVSAYVGERLRLHREEYAGVAA